MASIVEWDFPDIKRGDTTAQVTIIYSRDGSVFNLDGIDEITIKFRHHSNKGTVSKTLTLTNGDFTIIVAANGSFRINRFSTEDMEVGLHYYDMQFDHGSALDNSINTYMYGVMNVTQDATHAR